MRFPGKKKWQAEQELRGGLAADDERFRRLAALIDLDHILDTGRREEIFADLAKISERYCLDPSTVSQALHSLYPDLAAIESPPPSEITEVII